MIMNIGLFIPCLTTNDGYVFFDEILGSVIDTIKYAKEKGVVIGTYGQYAIIIIILIENTFMKYTASI